MRRLAFAIGILFIFVCSSCTKKVRTQNPVSRAEAHSNATVRIVNMYYESQHKQPEDGDSPQKQAEFANSFYSFNLSSFEPHISLTAAFGESFFENHVTQVKPTEYFKKGGFKLYLNFEKDNGKLDTMQLTRFSLATEPPKLYKNLRIYKACLAGTNCRSDRICTMMAGYEECGPDFEFDGFSIDYTTKHQDDGARYQYHISEKEFWVITENKEFFSRILPAHSGPTLILEGWELGSGRWTSENTNFLEITFRNLRNVHTGKKYNGETTVRILHVPKG